uniref:RNA-dependent RNA polymerase n=1 Tax=Austropuccinia psidii associated ssRNA virus 2 TaxID=3367765 RepID=A0AB74UQC0_9VIRU
MSSSEQLLAEILNIKDSHNLTPSSMAESIVDDSLPDLTALILRRAMERMEDARREYFRKPVVSVPFNVDEQTAKSVLRSYPEIREFNYKPGAYASDGLFRMKRHMTIRQSLLRVTKVSFDVDDALLDTVDEPIENPLILDGIEPKDYMFIFRNRPAIFKYASHDYPTNVLMQGVIDHFNATDAVDDIFYRLMGEFSDPGAEFTIITPFTQDMVELNCGNCLSGGYAFEWVDLTHEVTRVDYNYPKPLPTGYFFDDDFASVVLRVYPYGSDVFMEIPRHIFNMLHMSFSTEQFMVETKMITQGFAEASVIFHVSKHMHGKGFVMTPPHLYVSRPGYVRIREKRTELVQFMPGLQYSLRQPVATYVSEKVYNRAARVALQLRLSRNLAAPLIQHLSTYTSRLTFNGVIIKVDEIMHPEVMALMVEHVLAYSIPQKLRIEQFSEGIRSISLSHPKEILVAIARFMVYSAMHCTSVDEVVKTVHLLLKGQITTAMLNVDTSAETTFEYSATRSILSTEKESEFETLQDTALAMFGPSPNMTFDVSRDRICWQDDFKLVPVMSEAISRYKTLATNRDRITVEDVQFIYDLAFPGVSTTNYTDIILMRERVDHNIVLDVPSFSSSIYNMLSDKSEAKIMESRLRTEIGMDLPNTFRTILASLMKRNFNRPRPELLGKHEEFVTITVSESLKKYGVKHYSNLMTTMQLHPISPNEATLELWRKQHTEDELKAAAAIITGHGALNKPEDYNLMGKGVAKPTLDGTAGEMILVGQTVVFHPKDVIALTVGMFTIVLERLLSLFPDSIRFAFGADEHTSGEWADKYLNTTGLETHVYEFDMPKFDKSQDFTCYSLVATVLEIVGCSADFIAFWRQASMQANVFNSLFGIVFIMFFGNRSGCAGTIAINCIVLLFSFMDVFSDAEIIAMLIKGDDSVVVLKRPINHTHIEIMHKRWGFTMKQRVVTSHVTFCSSIFVKNCNDKYVLIRDPVKILTKLGRALDPTREASYFMDYYTSIVDTAMQYDDDILVNNLQLAVTLLYRKEIDVRTIITFIQQLASSPQFFLEELYGVHAELVPIVTDAEICKSVIYRAKADGFIKSKLLREMHPSLRRPFIDITRSYSIVTSLDVSLKSEIITTIDSWIKPY